MAEEYRCLSCGLSFTTGPCGYGEDDEVPGSAGALFLLPCRACGVQCRLLIPDFAGAPSVLALVYGRRGGPIHHDPAALRRERAWERFTDGFYEFLDRHPVLRVVLVVMWLPVGLLVVLPILNLRDRRERDRPVSGPAWEWDLYGRANYLPGTQSRRAVRPDLAEVTCGNCGSTGSVDGAEFGNDCPACKSGDLVHWASTT